ncbi:MAG TPA: pitrilysin family protein [Ilumatobacteraceae bacterium]|nr:pitrilysin family protein [Ilumatobacteraceae bacterium]
MTDLRITQLESGLTVATEHVPGALSVATGVWVAVGSRDEPAELSGVSHFLEHLLFKGTPTRSSQDISRSVDRVGGDFNAFTAKEYTAYYCRLPARHAVFGVDLLGDVLIRPALRESDVDSERLVILEELAMDDDSPDDVAHRMFAAQLFADHPLGRETAGDRDTVQAINAADVRQFFESHYHAGSMVVTLAGPIDHDDALQLVSNAFADVRTSGHTPVRTAPTTVGGSDSMDDDTEQIHIVMGLRSLARGDEDREALDVVNHVFGGGLSSRLFDEIRERRGLAYSVYSGASAYTDSGAFQMYAGTQPEHGAEVIDLMRSELERLVSDGITDDELDVAVGYLTGAFELGLEDTGARMARNGGQLITTGSIRPIAEQVARWAAVDQTAVKRTIGRVFIDDPITVTVGPTSS